jgi:hypothetical protein
MAPSGPPPCWSWSETGPLIPTCPGAVDGALWRVAPATNDWNTPTNWTPATVPTGTAVFGASGTTSIAISSNITINTIQINAGAPAYTFTGGGVVAIDFIGAGIVNNSRPR